MAGIPANLKADTTNFNQLSFVAMRVAQFRREQELRQLVLLGVPLRTRGKSGHWVLGPLHIYTYAGRWLNECTGERGQRSAPVQRRVGAQVQDGCGNAQQCSESVRGQR